MKGIVALISSFLLIAVLAYDVNAELSFNPPFTQFDYRGRISMGGWSVKGTARSIVGSAEAMPQSMSISSV